MKGDSCFYRILKIIDKKAIMNFDSLLSFSSPQLKEWALAQDQKDRLRGFREQFYIPQQNDKSVIYLCGNSLGLQPKNARLAINKELETWQNHGVEGWFEGESPWLSYHKYCQKGLAKLLGTLPEEVCPMHQLTVNLHLMLTSFYRPTSEKFKILTIAGDFPSDQYALETHVASRGYVPREAIIEIAPRIGEWLIHTEDIVAAIKSHAHELALVCMSGLQYYTGQLFDMREIVAEAKKYRILVGFDLAHAIGNVPLQLHQWDVDFAVWCSYKYLNSGPGGVSGVFVHQKHHDNTLPRLAGWWGYEESRRFEMTKGFVPMQGAAGWQLSTPNIMALAIHRASLGIFEKAGIENLRTKSIVLTQFLELVIKRINQKIGFQKIKIITPSEPSQRGSQLSLLVEEGGKELFDFLLQEGIVGDWREPNCIRLTPVPLYNTFEEIWELENVLLSKLEAI